MVKMLDKAHAEVLHINSSMSFDNEMLVLQTVNY